VKLPFRFFRGELSSGFYLFRVLTVFNHALRDIFDEMVYQTLFQWKTEEACTAAEMPVRDVDVIGIGKIAGLFQLRAYGGISTGSVYFTPSHSVNGKERSERGLFNMDSENFDFVRTEHDEYPDDIANEAAPMRRMSLIPEGAEPAGYVREGAPAFSEAGDVLWENILSEPPADGTPYTPFYGEQYLHFEEFFYKELPLPVGVFKLLLECVQRIRYSGPTLKGLFDITDILGGGGYIRDLDIGQSGRRYFVTYRLDPNFVLFQRERRLAAWKAVCEQKFKLFTFMEAE
jgi:hypothetical protein